MRRWSRDWVRCWERFEKDLDACIERFTWIVIQHFRHEWQGATISKPCVTRQETIKDDVQRPDINLWTLVLLAPQHLQGRITCCPTEMYLDHTLG